MKHRLSNFVVLTTLAFGGSALAQSVHWAIDPAHSNATFTVRHMMVSNVRGEFGKLSGGIDVDGKDLTTAKVETTIDVASVSTHEPKRDDHLRSAAFFDVAKFPTITFKSKKVERAGEGKLKVTGDLTIHGVTKEVVLDVDGPTPEMKTPWGDFRVGASATTTINRKDFGVVWNQALETGGVLVGDEVKIALEVELFRK